MNSTRALHSLDDLVSVGVKVPPRPIPPFEPPVHSLDGRERQLNVEYQEACMEWIETVTRLHLAHFPPTS